MSGIFIAFIVSLVVGSAIFNFSITLISPQTHNPFMKAVTTSAVNAVLTVAVRTALGVTFGGLLAAVLCLAVIKQSYGMSWMRTIIVVVINSLLSSLVLGFIGARF
jgi:hypothetical protein